MLKTIASCQQSKITNNKSTPYSLLPAPFLLCVLCVLCGLLSSCSKIGYGVLLWSMDEPPIPSGTILPVYIKSNIEQLWVIGVPGTSEKIEIPLSQLEFSGNKLKARRMARDFAQYAPVYAESLQDGLPIREKPDNVARRIYRLRLNEILKILEKVEGSPPIGATGEPLEGDWFLVLTNDGVKGYCFSYRLKLFDHTDGTVIAAPVVRRESEQDPELVSLLAKTWVPHLYQQMIDTRQLNIEELEKNYQFDPGYNSGVARIIHPDITRNFRFDKITRDGERFWLFEGSTLQMHLRTNTSLEVRFLDNSGASRTVLFTTISADIEDLIEQETTRREDQFMALYDRGPVFTSNNYGTITFSEEGDFSWTDYDLLVPQFIPNESTGNGKVSMDLFITPAFADNYTGAANFIFTDIVTPNRNIIFLYTLDNQGLRLEVVPSYGLEGDVIIRRESSPFTLYFFKDTAEE